LSREDAADIAQLTFTILVQNLDTLHDDSRLGSWLATVARRHSWRLLERNRERNRDEIASEHLENSSLAESVALLGKRDTDSIEYWELTDWLDTALSKISERCRKLLLALYFQPERSSYTEVAARLDIPIGSIGPTRARCLQKLRRVIGEG
jgi:RNA polymerase sigma factor (sigma-70 family)